MTLWLKRPGDPERRFYRRANLRFVILFLCFGILCLMSPPNSGADEWYEGGSLHSTSVRKWKQASSANRLATAADWFLSMTGKSNKELQMELTAMGEVDYQEAFRYYASRLERCVSEKVGKRTVRQEDRISDYAEKCYKTLHGTD
ncbi:MAG TPA: hypothetical protein PK425_08355 [Syntrophales bacterium]|jgi:hypothetical protein|nr:hypothetical protein [Syntrophales bacterium]HPX56535.1 hypothetical protein [Syntrophales bacterium]HQA83485.1 hypothetical protein [Syntrophales bacterium]